MDPHLRYGKLWWTVGYLIVALIVYLSVATISVVPEVSNSDKIAHTFAYCVAMSWFAQIETASRPRLRIAIALLTLGIALEFVQAFLPARSCDVLDMVANAGGVGLGFLLAPPRVPNALRLIERLARRA